MKSIFLGVPDGSLFEDFKKANGTIGEVVFGDVDYATGTSSIYSSFIYFGLKN